MHLLKFRFTFCGAQSPFFSIFVLSVFLNLLVKIFSTLIGYPLGWNFHLIGLPLRVLFLQPSRIFRFKYLLHSIIANVNANNFAQFSIYDSFPSVNLYFVNDLILPTKFIFHLSLRKIYK